VGASGGSGAGTPTPKPASGSAANGAPPGAQVLGTVAHNQPFTISLTNGQQTEKFRLTATSITCGKGLDSAVLAYAATSVGAKTRPSRRYRCRRHVGPVLSFKTQLAGEYIAIQST
jgi:hypothetical protein